MCVIEGESQYCEPSTNPPLPALRRVGAWCVCVCVRVRECLRACAGERVRPEGRGGWTRRRGRQMDDQK